MRHTWMDDAACRDMDLRLFYGGDGDNGERTAKMVCYTCPVMLDCLRFVMATESSNYARRYGVWGATNPAQRRRIAAVLPRVRGTYRQRHTESPDDDRALLDVLTGVMTGAERRRAGL